MKKEDVILSCYSLLRRLTPLDYDCGKICEGKCCKGDSNTGMLLFPGEEGLIDPEITVIETQQGDKLAVCNGSCDRNRRPLACRIYPLFPIITEENGKETIKVCKDYRANCPLVAPANELDLNRHFINAVKRVGKYLLLNDETKAFYTELSEMCADYYKLREKFK